MAEGFLPRVSGVVTGRFSGSAPRNSSAPAWMRDVVGGGGGVQKLENLNHAEIDAHDERGSVPLSAARPGASLFMDVPVDVFFQDLEHHLIEEIEHADAVVGCMAWLTNKRVLEALAKKKFVSIIVQKEDFLRPDSEGWSRETLLNLYEKLPIGSRLWGNVPAYSFCCDDTLGPVRCVGMSRRGKSTIPRMHHKFLVFCYTEESNEFEPPSIEPYRVWTGSFNATENGSRSLENAVLLNSREAAEAFRREWDALLGISEPLDWESEWVQPEYRIGS